MQVIDTPLEGVKIVRPQMFGDQRGWFAEMFQAERFGQAGLPTVFSQDNQSLSARGVLRGIHYQLEKPQGKLVRCAAGRIWDVPSTCVEVRNSSVILLD